MRYGVWEIEKTKEKFLAKTVERKVLVDLRELCFLLRRNIIFVVKATVIRQELRI